MMVIFISVFTTFSILLSFNLNVKLSDLEFVEGEILTVKKRLFIEKEWKNIYVGYKYEERPRLVIKLKGSDSLFTIDRTTYSGFWQKLLENSNIGKTAKIYKRKYEEKYRNPMQIEIGDKTILPLSFHKKWDVSAFLVLLVLISICLYILKRNLKAYRKVCLKQDKQYFKDKKYTKIISLWFNIY
ncbi:MAG: hypothetical protein ABI207_07790 [Crocinitomicaceae bacterium]